MPPKDKGKDKGGDAPNIGLELGIFLLALILISYIITGVNARLAEQGSSSLGGYWAAFMVFFRVSLWPVLKIVFGIVGVASVVGIIHNNRQLAKIANEERAIYRPERMTKKEIAETPVQRNGKWEKILELTNSANASDWRLAIIEADIMLDELLRAKGYHGDSVGDMLKSVDKSDMLTLESAWEAHKVRNRIAHGGSEFSLNEREAKQTIGLFELVFKEFRII